MRHHIETDALTKFYGRNRGIEDLTLAVGPGEVFMRGNDPKIIKPGPRFGGCS